MINTYEVEPDVFELLQKIKKQINPPSPGEKDLVAYIVDSIREKSDELKTPIFRINNKFFIYDEDIPLDLPNKHLEMFFSWICKHLNIRNDAPFRNKLFGRAYRTFQPDEE